MSLIGLLRLACCLEVSLDIVILCGGCPLACCKSNNELMAWNGVREA